MPPQIRSPHTAASARSPGIPWTQGPTATHPARAGTCDGERARAGLRPSVLSVWRSVLLMGIPDHETLPAYIKQIKYKYYDSLQSTLPYKVLPYRPHPFVAAYLP